MSRWRMARVEALATRLLPVLEAFSALRLVASVLVLALVSGAFVGARRLLVGVAQLPSIPTRNEARSRPRLLVESPSERVFTGEETIEICGRLEGDDLAWVALSNGDRENLLGPDCQGSPSLTAPGTAKVTAFLS